MLGGGQQRREASGLGDVADVFHSFDASRRRTHKPRADLEQRRFSRAVGAHDRAYLTRLELEAHIPHNRLSPVPFADVPQPQNRRTRMRPVRTPLSSDGSARGPRKFARIRLRRPIDLLRRPGVVARFGNGLLRKPSSAAGLDSRVCQPAFQSKGPAFRVKAPIFAHRQSPSRRTATSGRTASPPRIADCRAIASRGIALPSTVASTAALNCSHVSTSSRKVSRPFAVVS